MKPALPTTPAGFALWLALGAAAAGPARAEVPPANDPGLSFEGLVQVDLYETAGVSGFMDGSGDQSGQTKLDLRRAELVLKGTAEGGWSWVLGYDVSSEKLLDANLQFHWKAGNVLTVGQFKQPNSLEELSSTRHRDFIAKALATNVQAVGRRTGLQMAHLQRDWGVTGSVYGSELTGGDGQEPGFGLRGHFVPVNEPGRFLHLGLSYHRARAGQERDKPPASQYLQGAVTGAALSAADLVSSVAGSATTRGAEAAWVSGPLKLQAEYLSSEFGQRRAGELRTRGGYLLAVYSLTGEGWGYRNGLITPGLPADPSRGLWQTGLRYDRLSTDQGLGGAETWTLGVNWYWRSHLRFSANYLLIDAVEDREDRTSQALELRAQLHW